MSGNTQLTPKNSGTQDVNHPLTVGDVMAIPGGASASPAIETNDSQLPSSPPHYLQGFARRLDTTLERSDNSHHGRPGTAPDDDTPRPDTKRNRPPDVGANNTASGQAVTEHNPVRQDLDYFLPNDDSNNIASVGSITNTDSLSSKRREFAKAFISLSYKHQCEIVKLIGTSRPTALKTVWVGNIHFQTRDAPIMKRSKEEFLDDGTMTYQKIGARVVVIVDELGNELLKLLINACKKNQNGDSVGTQTSIICVLNKSDNTLLYFDSSTGSTDSLKLCSHPNCNRVLGAGRTGVMNKILSEGCLEGAFCSDYDAYKYSKGEIRGAFYDCQDWKNTIDSLHNLEGLARSILEKLLPQEMAELVAFIYKECPSAVRCSRGCYTILFSKIDDDLVKSIVAKVSDLSVQSTLRRVADILEIDLAKSLSKPTRDASNLQMDITVATCLHLRIKEINAGFTLGNGEKGRLVVHKLKLCEVPTCNELKIGATNKFCKTHLSNVDKQTKKKKKKKMNDETKKDANKVNIDMGLRIRHFKNPAAREHARKVHGDAADGYPEIADGALECIRRVLPADQQESVLAEFAKSANLTSNEEVDKGVIQNALSNVVDQSKLIKLGPGFITDWNGLLYTIMTSDEHGCSEFFMFVESKSISLEAQQQFENNQIGKFTIVVKYADVFIKNVLPNAFGVKSYRSFVLGYNSCGITVRKVRNEIYMGNNSWNNDDPGVVLEQAGNEELKKELTTLNKKMRKKEKENKELRERIKKLEEEKQQTAKITEMFEKRLKLHNSNEGNGGERGVAEHPVADSAITTDKDVEGSGNEGVVSHQATKMSEDSGVQSANVDQAPRFVPPPVHATASVNSRVGNSSQRGDSGVKSAKVDRLGRSVSTASARVTSSANSNSQEGISIPRAHGQISDSGVRRGENDRSRVKCKFFWGGGCRYGDKCQFSHEDPTPGRSGHPNHSHDLEDGEILERPRGRQENNERLPIPIREGRHNGRGGGGDGYDRHNRRGGDGYRYGHHNGRGGGGREFVPGRGGGGRGFWRGGGQR